MSIEAFWEPDEQLNEAAAATIERVAVLFSRLSGYMATCLKTLHERHGIELLVFRTPTLPEAPFDPRHFDWIDQLYDREAFTVEEMRTLVESFDPQAVLMAGWSDRGYRQVTRILKKRNIPIIAGSDAQWTGSFRQHVGRLIAPWYLHSAIDVLWVTGERQRRLASKLGFTGERCWNGAYYTCDWDQFAGIYERSKAGGRPHAFLYAGRYLDRKGLDVLVEAYARYRSSVDQPWSLICVGTGEQKGLLTEVEGIIDKGFIQPDQLPDLMGQASAFVLPSRREPWGVVMHEAAAAGLPLICSDVCGAAAHLLQDGRNGFLFPSEDAHALARGMTQLSQVSREEWEQMSRHSHRLSQQYTPHRWADRLVEGIASLQSARA